MDPSLMRAQIGMDRAQTPVSGLEYSTVRKMKLKYDTGAKIINVIRRAVELATSATVNDAQLGELVDVLLDTEVSFPSNLLLWSELMTVVASKKFYSAYL
jgi:hypothetical protein